MIVIKFKDFFAKTCQLAIIILLLLVSCQSPDVGLGSTQHNDQASTSAEVINIDENVKIAMGQTIYVPTYSHIYHQNRQNIFPLAVTLSIRNTDLAKPIIITSINYYDSDGKLVKNYLESPIKLDVLASTEVFVTRDDTSGGSGANFLVEWISETVVSEPIVEAVMIGTDAQQGISFIGSGKVIKSNPPE